MVSRRGFLKRLGLGAAAVVAAPLIGQGVTRPGGLTLPSVPLYIPPQNLDYGVPRKIITATPEQIESVTLSWRNVFLSAEELAVIVPIPESRGAGTVQMTLIQSEYMAEHGGKLPAGAVLMVDESTAARWTSNGIAVPGPQAPLAMQEAYAKRSAERVPILSWSNTTTNYEAVGFLDPDEGPPRYAVESARLTDDSHDSITDLFRKHINRAASAASRENVLAFDDAEFVVPAFEDRV